MTSEKEDLWNLKKEGIKKEVNEMLEEYFREAWEYYSDREIDEMTEAELLPDVVVYFKVKVEMERDVKIEF